MGDDESLEAKSYQQFGTVQHQCTFLRYIGDDRRAVVVVVIYHVYEYLLLYT